MNIKTISLTAAVADDDGIALAQTKVGANTLTLNGAFVAGGIATLVPPSRVSLASTGNISTVVFTITGTDYYDRVLTSTVTGINNNAVATTVDFKTVTSIANSATIGTNVTAGTNGVSSTPWYCGDYRTGKIDVITIALSTGSTINYTVEFTPTNLNDITDNLTLAAAIAQAQNAVVFASTDVNVVGATTNQATNSILGMPGTRLTINSGAGTATMTIIQPNNNVA